MKKTITNRTHHPQYIQLFLAVLFLVLSAGQSLQAQQNEPVLYSMVQGTVRVWLGHQSRGLFQMQ